MTLAEYYFRYLQEVGEGTLPAPEGICLTESEPLPRAAQLQTQIQAMGVPEFVRRCAAVEGLEIPQSLFDEFRPESLWESFANASAEAEQADEDEPEAAQTPQIEEPDGPRNAYEVLLDCCNLDENLLYYLFDVLHRGAEEEFQKLALVTARKAFTRQDFLYWLATLESRGSQEELVCATLMDACLERLAAQGEKELIAALISGDQTTFELFRCEAPELVHLPQATFDWFRQNYLERYYPVRYLLKFSGVALPKEAEA